MSIKERIKRLEQKVGCADNFSLIPERERVVWAAGYTKEERESGMQARLSVLHEKYGAFDESCLTLIYIREFRLNGGIVEG